MSMNAALDLATECVTQPTGSGFEWRFKAPRSAANLDGPIDTFQDTTYTGARRLRTRTVVQLAVNLMGIHGTVEFDGNETGSARAVLERVISDRDLYIDSL